MKYAIFKSYNIFFTTDLAFLLRNEKYKAYNTKFSCDSWLMPHGLPRACLGMAWSGVGWIKIKVVSQFA